MALDRLRNEARTGAMLPEMHPLAQQFNAMMKMIEEGHQPHPMEIWELAQEMREADQHGWADRLCAYLPD
jgi:hypothetical protein